MNADREYSITAWLGEVPLATDFLQFLTTLAVAYVVYRLGLRAYSKQKAEENFRARYLDAGLDELASQLDRTLAVHRHNWTLMLRYIKEYREIEQLTKPKEFFTHFIEIDHASISLTANSRVEDLLSKQSLWTGCQAAFSFVQIKNEIIKSGFGNAIVHLAEAADNPDKADFLQEATEVAEQMPREADVHYRFASSVNALANLLARSSYTIESMDAFARRKDVKKILKRIEDSLPETT